MVLIAHRGNISGPKPEMENFPTYIDEAIKKGYHAEIDLWGTYQGNKKISISLGHDKPQYKIDMAWLVDRRAKLFIHGKNYEALCVLIRHWSERKAGNLKFFFHESERFSIIANTSLLWCHEIAAANNFSIIPLLSQEDIGSWMNSDLSTKPVFGICSDYVESLKK